MKDTQSKNQITFNKILVMAVLILGLGILKSLDVHAGIDLTVGNYSYYSLDNATNINDQMGSLRNWTIYQGTLPTTGILNGGLSFNSNSSVYLKAAGGGTADIWDGLTGDTTINTWVYWRNQTDALGTNYLLCSEYITWLANSSTLRLRLYALPANTPSIINIPLSNIPYKQWFMITWGYNATHQFVYLNGTYFTSETTTGYPNWGLGSDFTRLGAACGGGQEYFNGSFDEFGVWKKQLNESEITALDNSSHALSFNNFVGGGLGGGGGPTLFNLTAKTVHNDTYVYVFNATINGTVYYTTNGSIVPFNTNSGIVNISLSSFGYFDATYLNWDTASLLIANMTQTAVVSGELNTPLNNTNIKGVTNFSWDGFVDVLGHPITYTLFMNNVVKNITNLTSVKFSLGLLSDGNYSWHINGCDNFGSCQNTSDYIFRTDNSVPQIHLTYPTNILNWTNGSVAGYCSDNNLPYSPLLNQTDRVFTNDTHFILRSISPALNLSWSFLFVGLNENNYSVRITCNDTFGNSVSSDYRFSFDVSAPYCAGVADKTIFSTDTYKFKLDCFDESNLYLLNVSCRGVNPTIGSGFDFYTININTTSYNLNRSFVPNDTTKCIINTADAHTAYDIRDILNEGTVNIDNGKIIVSKTIMNDLPIGGDRALPDGGDAIQDDNDLSLLEYSGSNLITSSLNYDRTDRITFAYSVDESNNNGENGYLYRYSFLVTGKNSVRYINNDAHNGWFVIDDNYWLDFDMKPIPNHVTVNKISDNQYSVDIDTDFYYVEFNSLGIINRNRQDMTITVLRSSFGTVMGTCNSVTFNKIAGFVITLNIIVYLILGILMLLNNAAWDMLKNYIKFVPMFTVLSMALMFIIGC